MMKLDFSRKTPKNNRDGDQAAPVALPEQQSIRKLSEPPVAKVHCLKPKEFASSSKASQGKMYSWEATGNSNYPLEKLT